MKHYLSISRAQAGALTRLIQAQLEAYDEAIGEPARHRPNPTTRENHEPFTSGDLDLIEPLIGSLKKLFGP